MSTNHESITYELYQAKKSIAPNHMNMMMHASRCKSNNCTSEDFVVMKICKHCKVKTRGECGMCKTINTILQLHTEFGGLTPLGLFR